MTCNQNRTTVFEMNLGDSFTINLSLTNRESTYSRILWNEIYHRITMTSPLSQEILDELEVLYEAYYNEASVDISDYQISASLMRGGKDKGELDVNFLDTSKGTFSLSIPENINLKKAIYDLKIQVINSQNENVSSIVKLKVT